MIRTVLALLALATSAHAQASVAGVVFEDTNGNGVRDPGERGVPNVVVSNQDVIEKTDASGHFRITRGPTGIVFVSVPDGFRIVGAFWHPADARKIRLIRPLSSSPATSCAMHCA
jgi:hypothetical protein